MRRACEEFLMARLPVPGLAACALRLPDGAVTHRCFNRWLSSAQVQQAFAELALSFDLLQQQEMAAAQTVWLFEHLRVVLCLRPDHGCLALFLENRADLPLAEVQAVLDEFAELPTPDQPGF
jgi:hypothetical protein